jgi:hypothetical protein
MNDDPTYRCDHCATTWSYRAVRYVACCPDCGAGLTRARVVAPAPPSAAAPVSAPSPLRQAAA